MEEQSPTTSTHYSPRIKMAEEKHRWWGFILDVMPTVMCFVCLALPLIGTIVSLLGYLEYNYFSLAFFHVGGGVSFFYPFKADFKRVLSVWNTYFGTGKPDA